MRELLVGLVGETFAPIAAMILAGVVVLILVLALLALLRRVGSGRLGIGGRGTPQPRIALLDVVQVDPKRRLVLVRRDEVEHLLMLGGPNDFVVEPHILRVPGGGGRRDGALRAEPGFAAPQPSATPQAASIAQRPRASEPVAPVSPAVVAPPPVSMAARQPAAPIVPAPQRAPTVAAEPRRAPEPVRSPAPPAPRAEPIAPRPEARISEDGGRRIEPSFPDQNRVAEPQRAPMVTPSVELPEPRRELPPRAQPTAIVAEPRVAPPRPPVQPMARTNPVPAEQAVRGEPSFDFVPVPVSTSAPRDVTGPQQDGEVANAPAAPSREDDQTVRQPLSVRSFASAIQNRKPEPAPRPAPAPTSLPAPMSMPAEPVASRTTSAHDQAPHTPAAAPAPYEADDDGLAALLQEEFTPREQQGAPERDAAAEEPQANRTLEDEMERLLRDFTTDASTRR